MIIDADLIYSQHQELLSVGDIYSTQTLDTGANRDIGNGMPLYLQIIITDGIVSAGATTLQVIFETSDIEDFSDPTDINTLIQTAEIQKDNLKTGDKIYSSPLPSNVKKYHRLLYKVGTSAPTALSVYAFLGSQPQTNNM